MASSLRSRRFGENASRFIAGHQTLATGFVGQASFANTTPTFILDAPANRTVIVARVTLSQLVAGGADVNLVFGTDIGGARYASGGAVVGSVNTNRVSSKTAGAIFYGEEPVAGAPTANVYYFGQRLVDNVIDLPGVIEFPDGIIIPASGSFLCYAYCGTSDAKFGVTLEWLETE